jgi:hypothetical protein
MQRPEPTFSLAATPLSASGGFALEARLGGERLGRRAFFEGLRDQPGLRAAHCDAIRATGLPAVAWETAPLSRASAERPMEQLVLPHPALARAVPDPRPFAEHLAPGTDVRWFTNFGGDAQLVVPCAPRPGSPYGHLVAFLAAAPEAQRDALWQVVGRLACEHLARSEAPLWVSTAGMAVSWLHVRLDLRPKYYRTEALRSPMA